MAVDWFWGVAEATAHALHSAANTVAGVPKLAVEATLAAGPLVDDSFATAIATAQGAVGAARWFAEAPSVDPRDQVVLNRYGVKAGDQPQLEALFPDEWWSDIEVVDELDVIDEDWQDLGEEANALNLTLTGVDEEDAKELDFHTPTGEETDDDDVPFLDDLNLTLTGVDAEDAEELAETDDDDDDDVPFLDDLEPTGTHTH